MNYGCSYRSATVTNMMVAAANVTASIGFTPKRYVEIARVSAKEPASVPSRGKNP
jgi:hypothetical protein